MNVLVTGGAGFIGAHLVKRLISNSDNVDVLDDFSRGKQENRIDEVKYIVRDIRSDLSDLKGYDVIFHLAALARIQPSFEEPLKTIDINTKGNAKKPFPIGCAGATKDPFLYIPGGFISNWFE